MKTRLTVLGLALAISLLLIFSTVALAGGDQVHRPDTSPQYQAVGEQPLGWQLQSNK